MRGGGVSQNSNKKIGPNSGQAGAVHAKPEGKLIYWSESLAVATP